MKTSNKFSVLFLFFWCLQKRTSNHCWIWCQKSWESLWLLRFFFNPIWAVGHLTSAIWGFNLETDLNTLTPNEQKMIPIWWKQPRSWMTYIGNKVLALSPGSTALPARKRLFAMVNYGPWDRLNDNKPILTAKQNMLRCQFYPADMTAAEFDAWRIRQKFAIYHGEKKQQGKLEAIPTINFLRKSWKELHFYLNRRASNCRWCRLKLHNSGPKPWSQMIIRQTDMAWLDMKTNKIDIVMGPIENYEDQLFGYKTSCRSICIDKKTWNGVENLKNSVPSCLNCKRATSRRPYKKKRLVAILN